MPAGGEMMMNMTANASMPSANSSVYCLPSILSAVEKISGKPLTFSTITVSPRPRLRVV
jgi:hypothetical protein